MGAASDSIVFLSIVVSFWQVFLDFLVEILIVHVIVIISNTFFIAAFASQLLDFVIRCFLANLEPAFFFPCQIFKKTLSFIQVHIRNILLVFVLCCLWQTLNTERLNLLNFLLFGLFSGAKITRLNGFKQLE